MIMHDEDSGITVELAYDREEMPVVTIELSGGYLDLDNLRPALEVVVDGVVIHHRFNSADRRWVDRQD